METNGNSIGSTVPSTDGETVLFQSEPFGDAEIGTQTLYRAHRTSSGWQTKAIAPKAVVQPKFFSQTPQMFFTSDLKKIIYTSEQPFDAGDQDEGALDLYLQSENGSLTWITRGPEGGTLPASATFDGATPDANNVVFNSFESLVPAATGMEGDIRGFDQYLYNRNLSTKETTLVNVDNEGKLLDPLGAILGNGDFLAFGEPPQTTFLSSNVDGTTTNAISNDGKKIFFESPLPDSFKLLGGRHGTHLYMRKENSLTVPLDNIEGESGESRYLGASEDGSKVFFLSNEGLAGDAFTDNELYMYDTETETATAISAGPQGSPAVDGAAYGVTAISNDGSHVYYVAKGNLAANTNGMGQSAVEGEPNFYVYDTRTGTNTFITQLGLVEVEPEPGVIGRLVSYLDIERPAVPTPDGNVLVFMSELNLTGENSNNTAQVYRYEVSTKTLLCISCSPDGTGSSSIGGGVIGGGSYDPPGESAPMDITGEKIFFNTENALAPEDQNTGAPPTEVFFGELKLFVPNNIDVYEWENGKVYLLSSGEAGYAKTQGVTPSGNDVFVNTNVNLTKHDTGGYSAVYDVRVGGGFPETEAQTTMPCDSSEGCHGGPANPVFTPPSSEMLQAEPTISPLAVVKSKPPTHKTSKPKKAKKKKKKSKAKHHRKAKGKKAKKTHKSTRKAAKHG